MVGTADETYRRGCVSYEKFDYENAAILFEQAAEAGHGDACYTIGLCYELGYGVRQDLPTYQKWILKGKGLGNKPCQAESFLEGIGCEKDVERAMVLMEEASLGGNPFIQGSHGFTLILEAKNADMFQAGAQWLIACGRPGNDAHWYLIAERLREIGNHDLTMHYLANTEETFLRVPFLHRVAEIIFEVVNYKKAMGEKGAE